MFKLAVLQGRSELPLYGVGGMIPTARVQRGKSATARCASKGIVPATPSPIFNILSRFIDRFRRNRQHFDRNPLENIQHRDHMLVLHAGIAAEHERQLAALGRL